LSVGSCHVGLGCFLMTHLEVTIWLLGEIWGRKTDALHVTPSTRHTKLVLFRSRHLIEWSLNKTRYIPVRCNGKHFMHA
jgi:hypothetical protein